MASHFNHKTLREDVAQYIKERILSGEFKPGERINEVEIAKTLNISRGPVREALRQVEQTGLVSYAANRGCRVAEISLERQMEITLIRCTLEMLSVKVCGGKIEVETASRLALLAEDIDRAKLDDDMVRAIELDQIFHGSIILAAGLKEVYKTWKSHDFANVALYYASQGTPIMAGSHAYSHHDIARAVHQGDLNNILQTIQGHYKYAPSQLIHIDGSESNRNVMSMLTRDIML